MPEQIMDAETLNEIETAVRIIAKSDKQIGEVVLIIRGNEKPYVDIRLPAGSLINLVKSYNSKIVPETCRKNKSTAG